jgi:hypothetical protein
MKIVAAHQRRDGAMRAPQRRRRSSAAMLVINRDRNCVLLTAAYLLKGYQQSDAGRSTRRCSQYARCPAAAHTQRILKRDGTLNARTMEIRAIWRFSFVHRSWLKGDLIGAPIRLFLVCLTGYRLDCRFCCYRLPNS